MRDPFRFKRLWLLLFYPVAVLLNRLAQQSPAFIENVYSRGIYPFINTVLSHIFGLLPFSLAEILLYGAVIGLLAVFFLQAVRLLLRKIGLSSILNRVCGLAGLFGILLFAFYFLWGFNYARAPLAQSLALPVEARPAQQLETLCTRLARRASALRGDLAQDAFGSYCLREGWRAEFAKIPAAYAALGREIPLFSRAIPSAKGVLASRWMSYAGLAGIYIPFTAEANVNTDGPPLLFASSAAHESAHMFGIAREDEANFIAYLACARSSDRGVQYSGTMLALIHCGNALHAADQDAFQRACGHYSTQVQTDLRVYSDYIRSFEGPVSQAVTNINDTYLRANNQTEGVKSYGRMVDLLLAYFFKYNAI